MNEERTNEPESLSLEGGRGREKKRAREREKRTKKKEEEGGGRKEQCDREVYFMPKSECI